MKIIVDPAEDPLAGVLDVIASAYGVTFPPGFADTADTGSHLSGPSFPDGWDHNRLRQFADWLAPDAAEAVRYIAAHAPAVSIDDTIAHLSTHLGMQLSGQAMGGRMASVGFSWKAVSGVQGPPLHTDFRYRVYRMDPAVAAVLREVMGPPAAVQTAGTAGD